METRYSREFGREVSQLFQPRGDPTKLVHTAFHLGTKRMLLPSGSFRLINAWHAAALLLSGLQAVLREYVQLLSRSCLNESDTRPIRDQWPTYHVRLSLVRCASDLFQRAVNTSRARKECALAFRLNPTDSMALATGSAGAALHTLSGTDRNFHRCARSVSSTCSSPLVPKLRGF